MCDEAKRNLWTLSSRTIKELGSLQSINRNSHPDSLITKEIFFSLLHSCNHPHLSFCLAAGLIVRGSRRRPPRRECISLPRGSCLSCSSVIPKLRARFPHRIGKK